MFGIMDKYNYILRKRISRKLYILSFLLLFILSFFSLFQYINTHNHIVSGYIKLQKKYECYSDNLENEEICQQLLKAENNSRKFDSTQNLFFSLFNDYALSYLINFAILVVIIPSLYVLHKKIHSGFLKNEFMRMSYKSFLKKNLFECYMGAFIIPIVAILLFGICFLISKHFDLNIGLMEPVYKAEYMTSFFFYVLFFVNILLHSIFYISIGLFYIKKYKSFLISILASFFTFYASEILLSIILGHFIFNKLLGFKYMYDTLSLLNLFCYYGLNHYYDYFIFSIILSLSSVILIYYFYYQKELF